MEEHDFTFIGSEKSTRAGMNTVTEDEVVRGGRDKLMSVFISRLLAFVVESVSIVSGCIWIDGVIFQRIGRDREVRTFRDHSPIGEHNFFQSEAVQGSCYGMSASHGWGRPDERRKGVVRLLNANG